MGYDGEALGSEVGSGEGRNAWAKGLPMTCHGGREADAQEEEEGNKEFGSGLAG